MISASVRPTKKQALRRRRAVGEIEGHVADARDDEAERQSADCGARAFDDLRNDDRRGEERERLEGVEMRAMGARGEALEFWRRRGGARGSSRREASPNGT